MYYENLNDEPGKVKGSPRVVPNVIVITGRVQIERAQQVIQLPGTQ